MRFLVLSACAIFLTSSAFSQTFETDSSNTVDNLLWASSINWDQGSAPGSNAGGSATDDVVFSHHEAASGQQNYRIATDVGQINNLEINGGTSTGNGGAGDHVQLQIRTGANLVVDGTTTLGANERGSILMNQGVASLALNGDINLAAGASGDGLNSFINHTSNSTDLLIGGNINGQAGGSATNIGGIDLRFNSTNQVIFNTTGGTTSDTNAQTFNVDDFGVGYSGDNNDTGVLTLGQGKIVNAEDLRVGENTSNSTDARAVSGDFTIDNTTVSLTDDALIGRVANGTGAGSQDRSGTGILTLDNAASLNVGDDMRIGDGAATGAAGQDAVGTVNINGGSTIAVNDEVVLGATDFAEGTLNVNDGTLTTTVGQLHIGGDFSSTNADANSQGTVNVGAAGTVTIGDGSAEQHIFIGRDGLGTMTSAGNVTITDGDLRMGDSTVATGEANTLNITGGVFDVSEQVIVGMTAGNEGTINVSGGLFQSGEEIYLGGNGTNGVDDGSTGTLNITGGRVLVNDGAFTTNQNVEVGRDGTGFLTVDSGTLDIHTGNLVFGQDNTNSNNSRGTGLFDNGATINIGDTHVDGANTDNVQNDLNINAGGADITHTGAGTTVNVENNMNMARTTATASVNSTSTYTISESAVLNIGNNFNARTNGSGTNTFTVVGGDTDVNIGNDLNVNESSFNLVFDFDGSSDTIYDFDFDVGNNAFIGGSTISLVDSVGDLNTFTGDIMLVDVVGSTTGAFTNFAEGDQVFGGAYMFTYMYNGTAGAGVDNGTGGGSSIALVRYEPVPEPGTMALMLGAGLFALRRRRRG